jgi:hypothetical protein
MRVLGKMHKTTVRSYIHELILAKHFVAVHRKTCGAGVETFVDALTGENFVLLFGYLTYVVENVPVHFPTTRHKNFAQTECNITGMLLRLLRIAGLKLQKRKQFPQNR